MSEGRNNPTAGVIGPRRPGRSSGAATAEADAAAESFYHLSGVDLDRCACRGTACFVARHLNPGRWNYACTQGPRVHCLGRCYAAPAAGADDPGPPPCRVDACEAVVLGRIIRGGAPSLRDYRAMGGYRALEAARRRPPESIVAEVESSGLRGRGGAGFPTGRKWRMASRQGAPEKHIVANADEGDAGAYIDRFILEKDPHRLIEAMAIAGHAVGASRGWLYLRREYPAAAPVLRRALDEARAGGFVGPDVGGPASSFDIELRIGRGSYLCGEETALLAAIEGKRPVPAARPPHATEAGLFGRPTVINNVETLASVPWIIEHGADAYSAIGFANSRGTKVVSLNSLFRHPGLYEVAFGTPLRRIVEDLGGGLMTGPLKGVMIGGPLAGVVPPHLLDTPFGFEELRAIGAAVGHGGVVAFDERTSIPELARHVFSFGAFESCGKCVPCRLGSRRVEEVFDAVVGGHADAAGCAESKEIVAALRVASLCGHGTGLAEFFASIVRHYGGELAPWFG